MVIATIWTIAFALAVGQGRRIDAQRLLHVSRAGGDDPDAGELVAGPRNHRRTLTLKAKDGSVKRDASEVVAYVADLNEPVTSARAAIRQGGRQFVPHVLAVAAVTKVTFPNGDNEEHSVFSHSSTADFDLGRYGSGRANSRVFGDVGVVEI